MYFQISACTLAFWHLWHCSYSKTWQIGWQCSFHNLRLIPLTSYILEFPWEPSSVLVLILLFIRFLVVIIIIYFNEFQAELNSFSDAPEPNIRFLAMLAGPLYPILYIVTERFVKDVNIHIHFCNQLKIFTVQNSNPQILESTFMKV